MKASETLHAPAKLNLTLEVLNRRPDGLHGVRSVMVPVDLCDEIVIAPSQAGYEFACDAADLMTSNLVERALAALNLPNLDARFELRKRIPAAAGMGGGSSDAAAVLLAAQRGIFGNIGHPDYLGIARSLGSDVPFFLVETAALVEGTGERVTALGAVPPWHAVVVQPPVVVPTGEAYRKLDESERPVRPRNTSASLQMAEALQRAQYDRVVSLMQNDFHDSVTGATPQIVQALDLLREAGATNALLTGSGSCVFALVRNLRERDRLAERIRPPDGYRVYPCTFRNGTAWRRAA